MRPYLNRWLLASGVLIATLTVCTQVFTQLREDSDFHAKLVASGSNALQAASTYSEARLLGGKYRDAWIQAIRRKPCVETAISGCAMGLLEFASLSDL
jgi:hypothetical protein